MISTGQLLIILVIALLIFGPRRLPELGKTIGKSLKNFKDSMNGITGGEDDTHQSANPSTNPDDTSKPEKGA